MTPSRARLALPLALAVLSGDCAPLAECAGGVCFDLAGIEHIRVGFAADTTELVDVDGNGHLDLVAVGHDYGTISVVWGGSAILEGTATTWSVAPSVRGLAVGDFDDDGRLDLATAVPDEDAIAVLQGSGGREFAAAVLHPVGMHPRDLIAIELGDGGASELVVAHEDGTIYVLRQGTAAPELSVNGEPYGLAAGDLDGDGDIDLALALPEEGVLQVLLSDGAGGFTRGARLPSGTAPSTVVAADFNGDGTLDLAATDSLDDVVHILLADDSGIFHENFTWLTAPDPRTLLVASQDAGLPVLIAMSAETGLVQQINPLTGATVSGALHERRARAIASGDVTGDGADDLLYVDDSRGRVGLLSPGPGLLIEPSWEPSATGSVFPVALDDKRDGLVINLQPQPLKDNSSTTLAIAITSGPDLISTPFASGLEAPLQGALAADLNDDGRRELVVWNRADIAVHERLSDGSLAPPILIRSGVSGEVLTGDVDGDGRSELLVVAAPNRLRAFAPFLSRTAIIDVQLDDIPDGKIARDVDGDGSLDLVLHDATSVLVYPSLHIELPPRIFKLERIMRIHALEVLDLERDGRPDAFVCHISGFVRYPDLFGPNPGDIEHLDNGYCQMLAATDLDGDGTDELLTISLDLGGGVAITPWRLRNAQLERQGTYTINATEMPRLARLDDSVPLNLLVPRPDGHAGILKMSLGTALQATALHSFGATLGLTFGDFDGDGALDLLGLGDAIGIALGDGQSFGPLRRVALDRVYPAARAITDAAIGNFDDDGADEVAFSLQLNGLDGYDVATFDLADMSVTRLAGPTPAPHKVVTADIDGDGADDLLALTAATELTVETLVGAPIAVDVAFYRGRSGGGFNPPITSRTNGFGPPHALQAVDGDGDGHLDLVTLRGGIGIHRGHGDGQFAATEHWSPVKANQFAVGDLDGDGYLDIAATLTGNGIRHGDLAVLDGSDMGRLAPPRVVLHDTTALAIADLEMDGTPELLAAGEDALYIGRNEDRDKIRFVRYDFPNPPPTSIRVLDVDGDAHLDLALVDGGGITLVRQIP